MPRMSWILTVRQATLLEALKKEGKRAIDQNKHIEVKEEAVMAVPGQLFYICLEGIPLCAAGYYAKVRPSKIKRICIKIMHIPCNYIINKSERHVQVARIHFLCFYKAAGHKAYHCRAVVLQLRGAQ